MQTIPLEDVIGDQDWKEFHPSDMTIDPVTKDYVLISSQQEGIVEITPDGKVLKTGPLPGKHAQAEGVAITNDGILIISDEATSKPASVSLFRWRPARTTQPTQ
jgi:uncharacterized protein YjiK